MLGGIFVKLAFLTCLVAVAAFYDNHKRGNATALTLARIAFHSTVVLILLISAQQLYNILTHDFRYTYVWSYSSRDLSTPLLISTFYAGQEGSFMLWTLFTALVGVFLLSDSSRKGYEPQVMTVYSSILLSLILMMVVKNPFEYIWEKWPGEVAVGHTPADGRGLNPLLQNYWMVIHPQVLFSGFAAMGVPYAYAIAALMKRDYTNWIKPATPWIVYGATVLGCGIMMGGFWAYETLGWGGYWGWDPVENSSLVPWLFSVATIHTILTQRKSNTMVKTNLVLAMLCFITVLYSSFLTRSGVLGETSVHSFVDPGMAVYWFLLGNIVFFIGLGAYMMIAKWKEMPHDLPEFSSEVGEKKHSFYSREFALFLGASAIVASAVLVTAGTSAPLISNILEGKASAMDIAFYVKTNLPIGIVIGVLAGIGQLLWWNRTDLRSALNLMLVPAAISVVGTLASLLILGLELNEWKDWLVPLFVFGAIFALAANLQVGWRIVKGNPKYAGGSIAHIGLAIMFLGFVGSAKYDNKETLSLAQGEPMHCLDGYKLTYTGYKPIENGKKYAFEVKVEHKDKHFTIAPIMYKNNEDIMRNPDILNLVTKDFYLAPLSLEPAGNQDKGMQTLSFKKGETKKVGELEVTFMDFNFPVDQKAAMLEGREVKIGATLAIKQYGKKPAEITPSKVISQGEATDIPATFEGTHQFTLMNMKPDKENKENSAVEIGYADLRVTSAAKKADVLVVEASVKPYINLVWSGVIVLLVGFIVTIVRRVQEARLREVAA
jgi:cytochrome c-type biogenesis protein CcmF